MIKIVLGLGFGDEGKGLTTSYLCQQNSSVDAVVRFNGGHQAGHTVVYNGIRHVFSNFGSGTLQKVPTYWHKYCTFHPSGVVKEFEVLKSKGITPVLAVHPLCPVTTPHDILHNQETSRRTAHGSVGVGFGSTLQRQDNYYKLHVQDLFYEKVLKEKLKNIANYYGHSCELHENFLKDVEECKKIIQVQDESYLTFKNLVFEGAQGILLDQDFGFFPHVTRSNTTSRNALEILSTALPPQLYEVEIFYVTRSYQTRHGNGFMTNEDPYFPLKNNEDETNISHPYQGEFRKGKLDIELLKYALDCDKHFSKGIKKSLMITCLDQTDISVENLKDSLSEKCKFEKIYGSFGPSCKDVKECAVR